MGALIDLVALLIIVVVFVIAAVSMGYDLNDIINAFKLFFKGSLVFGSNTAVWIAMKEFLRGLVA